MTKDTRNANSDMLTVSRDKILARVTCPICQQVYDKATTINECMHTFCEKCIYDKIIEEKLNSCPLCYTSLGVDPLAKLKRDPNWDSLATTLLGNHQEGEKSCNKEISVVKKPRNKKAKNKNNVVPITTACTPTPMKKEKLISSLLAYLPTQNVVTKKRSIRVPVASSSEEQLPSAKVVESFYSKKPISSEQPRKKGGRKAKASKLKGKRKVTFKTPEPLKDERVDQFKGWSVSPESLQVEAVDKLKGWSVPPEPLQNERVDQLKGWPVPPKPSQNERVDQLKGCPVPLEPSQNERVDQLKGCPVSSEPLQDERIDQFNIWPVSLEPSQVDERIDQLKSCPVRVPFEEDDKSSKLSKSSLDACTISNPLVQVSCHNNSHKDETYYIVMAKNKWKVIGESSDIFIERWSTYQQRKLAATTTTMTTTIALTTITKKTNNQQKENSNAVVEADVSQSMTTIRPGETETQVWFTLVASQDGKGGKPLPQLLPEKMYCRMNANEPVALVIKFLVHKLKFIRESEVEILLRGVLLEPSLEIRYVLDAWRQQELQRHIDETLSNVKSTPEEFFMALTYARA